MLEKSHLCVGCGFRETGLGYVPPEGPQDAMVSIIGEAPGEDEAAEGRPFVGKSGSILRRAMGTTELPSFPCPECRGKPFPERMRCEACAGCGKEYRKSVRVGNTIACRPPGNDYSQVPPSAPEWCIPRHLGSPSPLPGAVTFLVGGRSLTQFFPELGKVKGMGSIERWHGSVLPLGQGWAVPVIHPAFIMRAWYALPMLVGGLAGGMGLVGKVPGRDAPFTMPVLVDTPPRGQHLSVDIETAEDGSIDLIGVTGDGMRVWQGPVGEVKVIQPALDEAEVVFAHNTKFDVERLEAVGARFRRHTVVDTMWAQSIYQSDITAKSPSLGACCGMTLAGRQTFWKSLWGSHWKEPEKEVTRWVWRQLWPGAELDWYRSYNSLDVCMTWRLGMRLKEVLSE